mmetsp:Transcript_14217/g.34057  ORF Transcript_14217/g.34057 Transcript_14217/m.34057 type:complete len:182 (-) Transcript_14217:1-546(-)
MGMATVDDNAEVSGADKSRVEALSAAFNDGAFREQQRSDRQAAREKLQRPNNGSQSHVVHHRSSSLRAISRAFSVAKARSMPPMRSSRVVFLSDMEMSRHIAPTDLLKTEQARARVNGIVEEQTFSIPTSDSLPSFGQHEVQIGRFLGKGAFCRVEEILSFTLTDDESIQHTTSQLTTCQL